MKGILKPVGVAAGMIGLLALAGWSGAHMGAGVSRIDRTAAAQLQDATPGQEPVAGLAATPEVEPTERPEVEPRQPLGVEPTVTPSPVPTFSTSTATFTLVGGTVTLSCSSSGSINVDLVAPNPGFSVRVEHEDGAQSVEVRFESHAHESRLEAACFGGQVQVLELREESS